MRRICKGCCSLKSAEDVQLQSVHCYQMGKGRQAKAYSCITVSCKWLPLCAGYKISAMDVENALLAHPAVREVAVVGIPDEQLGQKARFPGFASVM